MADNKELEYDEDDAVKYIQNFLPQDLKTKLTNDDITYIIDIVYDFYDEKGLFSDNNESELVDIDEDDIIAYVLKNVQKDKIKEFTRDEVVFIIQGELAYCDSIGIFE